MTFDQELQYALQALAAEMLEHGLRTSTTELSLTAEVGEGDSKICIRMTEGPWVEYNYRRYSFRLTLPSGQPFELTNAVSPESRPFIEIRIGEMIKTICRKFSETSSPC